MSLAPTLRLSSQRSPPCENRVFPDMQPAAQKAPMDVEHINAIGNSLADLTQRTVDLRGYL